MRAKSNNIYRLQIFSHRHYITEFQYWSIRQNRPKIGPKFEDQLPAVDGLDSLENFYFFKFFKIIFYPKPKEFNNLFIVLFQQKPCLNAVNVGLNLGLPNFA